MAQTVLIIDDEGFDRTIIGALLAQAGFDVVGEAENGAQGIAMALELKPDLITLDRRMPDMDGIEVLKKLNAANYSNPIMIITGDDSKDVEADAKSHGVEVVLKKPVRREKMKAAIELLNQ